jgi:hypothetical protein
MTRGSRAHCQPVTFRRIGSPTTRKLRLVVRAHQRLGNDDSRTRRSLGDASTQRRSESTRQSRTIPSWTGPCRSRLRLGRGTPFWTVRSGASKRPAARAASASPRLQRHGPDPGSEPACRFWHSAGGVGARVSSPGWRHPGGQLPLTWESRPAAPWPGSRGSAVPNGTPPAAPGWELTQLAGSSAARE